MALRNWIEEKVADVNPFDGGKTSATVRNTRQATSMPATLPSPGQTRRFVPMKDPTKAMVSIPKRPVPVVPKVDTSFTGSLKRVGTQVGLGAARSAVGTAQGVSGLVDLATPGTGTSRVSQSLDRGAKIIDQTAAAEGEGQAHLNGAYKLGQFAGDAVSMVAGGAATKAAGKVATKAPVIRQTTRLLKPVTQAADRSLAVLDKGNVGQRVAATALRTASPSNLVNTGTNVGIDLGAEVSKGRDIDRGDIARSVATNVGMNTGLPIAGQLLTEGTRAAKPLVRPAVDAVADGTQRAAKATGEYVNDLATSALNVKPHRQIPDEYVEAAGRVRNAQAGLGEASDADYQRLHKLQEYVGGDINDPTAVDRIIQDRVTWEQRGRQAVIEQQKAIDKAQASKSGGYAKLPGGKSEDMTPIDEILTKKQKKLQAEKGKELAVEQTKAGADQALESEFDNSNTPQIRPGVAENRLTMRGKRGEQNISDETMAGIQGEHNIRSTAKLDEASKADISQLDDDTAIESARTRLTVEQGKINDEDVAFTNQAIERADAAGRTQDAVDLHDLLSEHLVKQGQTIQAASLLYRLSPQGMFFKARRDLIKSGTKLTPELETKLKQQTDDIVNAPDDAAKTTAKAVLGKTVADNMKKDGASKLISIWKAGLLSGQKTFQGGLISNATFAGLKNVADVPAAIADSVISLATGKRTKTATLRGEASGTIEGTKKGIQTFRTGIDERNTQSGGKFDQHGELNFQNKIIDTVFGKTTNAVFRTLSAADQPFYYAAAKNSLYDQAIAQGKTQGLDGRMLEDYVKRTVDAPTKQMAEIAKNDAEKAVLGFDTIGSKAISGIKKSIDNLPDDQFSKAAKATAHTVVDVLAPFVKVPTAFISRTIDFTPAAPFMEAIGQISRKKFDQRALSEAIGEGITGTGVIALGIALAQNDLLSGDYPKTDPKEAARWKAEGITPNSIKIGGTWRSLNYLGPVGLLFNAGKQYEDGNAEGFASQLASAAGGLGQGLMGQSFLQGFSGFSDAIQDPERNAKSFVNSQASSLVPAWSNDLANLTDPYQRQADTVKEAVKNRIPKLRKDNKIKQDVYGNKLKQAGGQVNTLNATKPSKSTTNNSPAIAEVSRLHSIDPDNKDLQVTPSAIDKKLSVEGVDVKLTNDQRYQLQEKVGQATQERWSKLIETPEYQALTDGDKAKALVGIRQASQELATREYVEGNGLATYKERLGTGARRLKSDGNIARFTKVSNKDSTGTSDGEDITYEDKYNDAKSAFDTDSADWSPVEKAKKKRELRKLTVQKDYDNDTVSLYGMSKEDVYALISTDENGKAMAKKILEYGDKLKAAGLGDNKFRDSKGRESIKPKEKGSGSGRGTTDFSLYSGSTNRLKFDKSLRSLVNAAHLS